jgi:hypothetical protein
MDVIKSSVQQNSPSGAVWLELRDSKTKTIPQGVVPYQHIFLAVYNYKTEMSEELIGQGVISLKPHVGQLGVPVMFKTQLFLGGQKRGSVRGNLTMTQL